MSKSSAPTANDAIHAYASTQIAHLMFAQTKPAKGIKRGSLKHAQDRLIAHIRSLMSVKDAGWVAYAKKLDGYTETTKNRIAREALAAYKAAHAAGESDVTVIYPTTFKKAKKEALHAKQQAS